MIKKKILIVKKKDRDLTSALIRDLTLETIECMICFDRILTKNRIWSCECCWKVFHMKCISKWSSSSSSIAPNAQRSEEFSWRCPGCQNQSTKTPSYYMCFCGKQLEPKIPERKSTITPHSCGDLCGRRKECGHKCELPCHPGYSF
jgi:transcriptional repressor NF-X1